MKNSRGSQSMMTTKSHSARSARRFQKGVLLEISLLLLIVLTLLGAMLARSQMGEERMAQNDNNRQLTMQVAESVLRTGESYLLVNYGALSFTGSTRGLYTLAPPTMPSQLPVASTQAIPFSLISTNLALALGSAQSAGQPKFPNSNAPFYTAFQLPAVVKAGNPGAMNSQSQTSVYEITAYATGIDGTSNVTLQSFWQ